MREEKKQGFTLVELAIVLVIIGIILGAVIKGQDLIANARAKRFASELRKWEVMLWTYYDRHHKFPANKDKLGGLRAQVQNPIPLGGTYFWFGFGKDARGREVLVVCPGDENTASCTSANVTEEVAFYFRNVDLSIDGAENATDGLVLCLGSGSINTSDWTLTGTVDNCSDDYWNGTGVTGLIYSLGAQSFNDQD